MIHQAPTASLIYSTLFASTDLPLEDQFDAWRERMSVVFNVEPVEPSLEEGFVAEAQAFHLGDLILARTRFEAQRFVRTEEQVRSDKLDHYLVQFYNEGGYVGELDGRPIEIKAGTVSILDLTRTTITRASSAECVSLVVPRDVMHDLLPRAVNLHGAVLDAGNGRLLSSYLVSLLRQLPTTEQSQAPHIARATCSLLAACLLPTVNRLSAKSDHASTTPAPIPERTHLKRSDVAPQSVHAMFDDWIRSLRS